MFLFLAKEKKGVSGDFFTGLKTATNNGIYLLLLRTAEGS
jgi:hypothetical protein